ncbi:MAG: hypothetical protein WC348_01190 [Patescibacteria group bacterium]|jgi:hypothetical protein
MDKVVNIFADDQLHRRHLDRIKGLGPTTAATGKIANIFADGQLHRKFLNRITALDLTPMNGCLFLRLTATGDVNYNWITDYVVFRFVVNGGEKTIDGQCWGLRYSTGEENIHYARIEFRDPETGSEKLLGEWTTLEIILIAGKEEKSFTANKEGNTTPEVKETS